MPLLKTRTLKSESLDPGPKLTNINKNSHRLEDNISIINKCESSPDSPLSITESEDLVRNGTNPESAAIKSKENHDFNAANIMISKSKYPDHVSPHQKTQSKM